MDSLNLSSSEAGDKYVMLFADCVPVKGATSSAIYDLTRHAISTFPSEYYPLFELFRAHLLGQIFAMFAEQDRENLCEFLQFLHSSEYMMLVQDPAAFPAMSSRFDPAHVVSHAVIDVNTEHHDYRKIVGEIDALRCAHLQIRSYSMLFGLEDLEELAHLCHGTSILTLDALLAHEPERCDDDYAAVVRDNRILSGLAVHSANGERTIRVDYGLTGSSAELVAATITVTPKQLGSHFDCGTIGRADLLQPSTPGFNELRAFNGCLNGKVAIDERGQIRNCPAMARGFGDHRQTALADVVTSIAFQGPWHYRKDDIEVCRDYQYRYACADCRAFVDKPGNEETSKPLKCGYDPYSDSWSDWRTRPSSVATMRDYRRRVHLPVVSSRTRGCGE